MQKTTTLTRLRLFFGKMLPLLILLAISVGKISAQPYVNGTLSTGATTASGVAAATGYTWSECQNPTGNTTVANTTAGVGAQVAANNSVADDFTVPSGQGWSISKVTVYGYSTNYTGAASPYNDVRIRIHRGVPGAPGTTIVYGDLTTNRFAASSDAKMHRIFNTVVTPATAPGTTRIIWKIEANVSVTLGPGVYWLEYQIGTAQTSNFTPLSTPVGVRTLPGYNAMQSLAGGAWATLTDPGQGTTPPAVNVDLPFTVDYSIVAAPPCTPITGAVINAPNVLINESFNTAIPLPTGWAQQNLSNPLGPNNWIQGNPANYPANSGATNAYITALWSSTTTTGTGTISNWLFAPNVMLKNGDQFSFYTRTSTGDFPDRLQVRMSTNGTSTNVGATETSTGDFGTLLLDINPTYTSSGYPLTWTKFTVTISGVPAAGVSGRLAFRYFVEDGGGLGTNSDVIGIDDVVYTAAGAPTICSGSSGNIVVNVTGGTAPYNLVLNANPGGNFNVNNYTSGNNIPVTPTANTTYTIVSVTGIDGCTSPANSGSATINVTSGSTAAVLSQVVLPPGPLVVFNEGLDGVMPPTGWAMQNLSNPVGLVANWRESSFFTGPPAPHGGTGYAIANFNNTTGTNTISNWLFTPVINNIKAGDKLVFWTFAGGTFADRLQVRLNPTDGTADAGTTNVSVGKYTDLLLDINPTLTATGYPTAWTQFTVTMPNNVAVGRIAFRYFVTNGGPTGANSNFIGLDDVSYTTTSIAPPPTTCTGSSANLKVDITGGLAPYEVTITPTSPAGLPFTVTGYTSGSPILVTPAVTTTYSLTSVKSAAGCLGTGNSGTPTITVSPVTTPALIINESPTGPLCAGDPKLLTVVTGPTLTTFTSTGTVEIPAVPTTVGIANPYPSNLVVSGLPTSGVTVKSVTLFNVSHTFPVDMDILLQSPTGTNVVIMSDVGGTSAYTNRTYTFDDAAAAAMTAAAAPAGTYKPSNVTTPDTWVAPGPGSVTQATPTLSSFTGNFNGTWKLFAVDDVSGDAGSLTGWNIIFSVPGGATPVGYTYSWSPAAGLSSTTSNPVAASPMTTTTYQVMGTAPNGCQTVAQVTITVNQLPAITTQPTAFTVCQNSNATFTADGSGAGATYQWQYATAAAPTTWINVPNAAPYSGVTTGTLTITSVPFSLNGYRYRLAVSGTCPPTAFSNGAVLTVNPAPGVTVTPATTCGGVAGINGVALTASGATTYTWAPLTGLYTNALATIAYTGGNAATVYAAPTSNTVYTVTGTNGTTGCTATATASVTYTPVAPTVSPVAVSICNSPRTVVPLTITSSLAPSTVSASSGPISVAVPDNTSAGVTSTLNISGVPVGATVSDVTVTLNMAHTYPGDMIFNLKSPATGKVLNLYKYNGGVFTGNNGNLVGAGWFNGKVTNNSTIAFSSVGAPYAYGTPPTGTPTGPFKADLLNAATGQPVENPNGYASDAAGWNDMFSPSAPPNGTWTLAMADGGPGDLGTLTSWSISFTYGIPPDGIWTPITGLYTDAAGTIPYVAGTPKQTVYASPTTTTTYSVTVANGTCTSPAKTVTVTVNNIPNITAEPVNAVVCTDKATSFRITATGTGLTYAWQVSTDQGNTFTTIANGGVYSGATTNTLTITAPPVSMNTYQYRAIVAGAAPCVNDTSLRRVLTVNPLPTATITAVPGGTLLPAGTTIIRAQVTPTGSIFQWYRNGVLAATTNYPEDSLVVNIDQLGTYQLVVQDINGCVNSSNEIVVSDSASSMVFVYPNPSSGRFTVRYHSSLNTSNLPRGLNIYDEKGARVMMQTYSINAPYAPMNVDMSKFGTGTYWVEVVDRNGRRLAMGRVMLVR